MPSSATGLKDLLYRTGKAPHPFRFNRQVARVFEDMAQRSIPGYQQLLDSLPILINQYAQSNTNCYDLGCSLAAAAMVIRRHSPPSSRVIAIDSSPQMIDQAHKKLHQAGLSDGIELMVADICQAEINNASLVIMNYTLQFINPHKRQALINKIYQSMIDGGLLLLSDKVKPQEPGLEQPLENLYHRFKQQQGYNQLEISRKRDALEKVLICDTETDHINRLRQAGFVVETWQRHFQFSSLIAWKPDKDIKKTSAL